jgi:hypothetical protein
VASIVLGIGTSHSPVLSTTDHTEWFTYAMGDYRHPELIHPDTGLSVTYEEPERLSPAAVRERPLTDAIFAAQYDACQRAIGELAQTLQNAKPDVTVIVSDDQDEMFFEENIRTPKRCSSCRATACCQPRLKRRTGSCSGARSKKPRWSWTWPTRSPCTARQPAPAPAVVAVGLRPRAVAA